jgi:hypothetical protein
MKKGLENFRDFGFIFPSFPAFFSISLPSHPPPHLPTRINSGWVFFFIFSLILFRLFFFSFSCLAMQRALSTRTSVLSAASKRAPFARSPLNLQQQRFAHKVRATMPWQLASRWTLR